MGNEHARDKNVGAKQYYAGACPLMRLQKDVHRKGGNGVVTRLVVSVFCSGS